MKKIGKAVGIVVNIISIALVLFSVAVLLKVVFTEQGEPPELFGYSMFKVMTGSMEPEIPESSAIITKDVPFSEIAMGDVITFYSQDPVLGGMLNTHRVVEIGEDELGTYLITKGDANSVEDKYPVRETEYVGKVIHCMLWLGIIVRLCSNPLVFLPLIVIPFVWIIVVNIMKVVKLAKTLEKEEEAKLLREWESRKKESEGNKRMKVLVTGVKGQLGFDVVNNLTERGMEAVGVDIEEMDITDAASVDKVIRETAPDAVIHCAAYTAVDAAEDNAEVCQKVNAEGTRNIAQVCKDLNIKMMYISTDYVFDGQGETPWEPDCKAYKPLSVYGRTKLEGELAVAELVEKYFIVRIAWVFGKNGNNFIKTMLRLGETHDTLRVVCDQIGTPTYTFDLARLLVDMILTEKYGYYHATNEGGYISWYDFACAIFKEAGMDVNVIPVTTEEYGVSKAARPFNSRLEKQKLEEKGFERLPSWQDALSRYINVLKS